MFDITPATEQALDWLAGLTHRPFIGTQSRLLTLFELLRQLADGTDANPATRIAELERRRAEIGAEIARIRGGALSLIDSSGVRERFLQITDAARALLSDFRAVEQNFRGLDRAVRERIATWEGGKGALLDEVLGDRDAISDSDQGKSFRAFWDFLMSPQRQEELSELLARVFALEPVQELTPDRRFLRLHHDWLTAGEVTQRTVARLSAELRRYLDDKAWLENRRIMEILREIEARALEVRDEPPDGPFMELDAMAPDIRLIMDRPLFSPPMKPEIDADIELSRADDIPADALFDRVYVDKERLSGQIRRLLQRRTQVSLAEVAAAHPLEHGLAELVAYLSLASDDPAAVIDDQRRESIVWTAPEGRRRQATVPLVIFARRLRRHASGSYAMSNGTPTTIASNDLPHVLITLMKGVLERESAPAVWQGLLAHQARVRDHVGVIGLDLVMDEAEGHAYLRQRQQVEGEPELPRLVTRRQLGFSLSLMLALLRKKLAEHDAMSGETRLVVSAADILDMVRLFLPVTVNEARLKDQVDTNIRKVVDLGFLRPLKGRDDTYEVRRILRSFVDVQWLGQLNERLAAYAGHAGEALQGEAGGTHE